MCQLMSKARSRLIPILLKGKISSFPRNFDCDRSFITASRNKDQQWEENSLRRDVGTCEKTASNNTEVPRDGSVKKEKRS